MTMVEFLGPGGGHGRGTSFHPLLLDLCNLRVVWPAIVPAAESFRRKSVQNFNWSILSPVHRVEVLVGLVHAVPRLVVIKMVEVDASLGGDISVRAFLYLSVVFLNKISCF